MDEQDKDEWHVRLLHAVEALPSRLSSLGAGISTIGVLLVVFIAQSGRCNCDTPKTNEPQCASDCGVRSGKPPMLKRHHVTTVPNVGVLTRLRDRAHVFGSCPGRLDTAARTC